MEYSVHTLCKHWAVNHGASGSTVKGTNGNKTMDLVPKNYSFYRPGDLFIFFISFWRIGYLTLDKINVASILGGAWWSQVLSPLRFDQQQMLFNYSSGFAVTFAAEHSLTQGHVNPHALFIRKARQQLLFNLSDTKFKCKGGPWVLDETWMRPIIRIWSVPKDRGSTDHAALKGRRVS